MFRVAIPNKFCHPINVPKSPDQFHSVCWLSYSLTYSIFSNLSQKGKKKKLFFSLHAIAFNCKMATESSLSAHSNLNQEMKRERRETFGGSEESKVPEYFIWPDEFKGSQLVPELHVPHIDVNKFLSGNESDVEEATRLVDEACREHGFFVVVNHGVDMELMKGVHECMNEFFTMPLDVKQRAKRKVGESYGYTNSFFGRFASKLPWKETFSLRCVAAQNSSTARDYVIDILGSTFSHHGYLNSTI